MKAMYSPRPSMGHAISVQRPKPVKKFQAGAITATIWENVDHHDPQKTYHSVSFDRTYKDRKGNWKQTNSLRTADLPKAVIVLKKAYEFLVLKDFAEGMPAM